MHAVFEVRHLYYLPQFLPVYNELIERGGTADFVFFAHENRTLIDNIVRDTKISSHWVNDSKDALEIYRKLKPDWVFFGNKFEHLESLHEFSKSAQLGHGVGPKSSYYTKSDTPMTIRFVEGQHRYNRLLEMYPQGNFCDVGFSKLDPIFNHSEPGLNIGKLGLDPGKKTIAYAPTFYPSSIENFPKDWPAQFCDYNILIKPHHFSLTQKRLKKQRQLLNHWATYPGVYLANSNDYSLVPFLETADILLSDASSAIIEFAALNKPVIWCQFLKLRWSYRGPLKFRLRQRMDEDYLLFEKISLPVESYKELAKAVSQQLQNPEQLAEERKTNTEIMMGKVDGLASKRIVDFLWDAEPLALGS